MENKETLIVDIMTIEDLESIKDNLEANYDEFWNENILRSEIENLNSKFFSLKNGNEIIGFGGYIVTPQDIQISNVVIKKNQRNLGYGDFFFKEILKNAENDLKKIDIHPKSISLEVNSTNKAAISLYTKNGFEQIGIRKRYYNNTSDAIIMSKNLT
ncbi:MAG: ribosomal protein S18-alanine N-acetyltransferase [Clostridia bacterium]|nr:ribosomal protein S18-alanine N-acetyltransferase [Clostridia bacterium]